MSEAALPGNGEEHEQAALRRIALLTSKSIMVLQRRAEEELQEARAALERQTQQLAASISLLTATLESTPDGIVVDDLHGRIVVHNSKFAAMWGVPADMMQRRDVSEVARHGMAQLKDGPAFLKRLDALRAQPESDPHDLVELLDGRIFERYASAHRVDGKCVGIVANWRDVTQRQGAAGVMKAKDLAENANRAKNDFISRMSHELRTPLNAVLGFAEVMQLDHHQPLPPAQRQRAERIYSAGSHLLLLIDDLLDVSRLEAGSLRIHVEDTDVAEVIREAVNDLHSRAHDLGISMVIEAPNNPAPHARSDRFRLRQVLHNLLSNAVKYNRCGGSVTVRLAEHGEQVHIAVADSGMGMDAQQLERLFRPFDRLGREASSIQGTGIGLVIVRNLVELMGGSLQVTSELGQGSNFVVVLPGVAHRPETSETAVGALPDVPPCDAMFRGRVLYVEDDEVNRVLMQAYLDMRPGIELLTAVDGASGIAAAAAHAPALILVDMMLPDMGGLDVLGGIRAQQNGLQVPCIAVSANAMPNDVAGAMAAGFDSYLTKPLTAAVLMREIDRLAGSGAVARRATVAAHGSA